MPVVAPATLPTRRPPTLGYLPQYCQCFFDVATGGVAFHQAAVEHGVREVAGGRGEVDPFEERFDRGEEDRLFANALCIFEYSSRFAIGLDELMHFIELTPQLGKDHADSAPLTAAVKGQE